MANQVVHTDRSLCYLNGKGDTRRRELLAPIRLISHSVNAECPEILIGSREYQSYMRNNAPCCRLSPGTSVLLDYGVELHGGIRIVCGPNPEGINKVRVRFGESVAEAMGLPNNDHMIHDAELQVPRYGMISYGCTGFRFLKLDVPQENPGDIFIYGVFAEAVYRELEYLGKFSCSDERLNRIWETGAYTVHLNMQDYIYDGIKRDRLVWMGDLNPEIRIIASIFGDTQLVQDSLDYVRDRTAPGTPMNDISSYSAWWVINQYDWYHYRGSFDYLLQQRSYLLATLQQLRGYVGEDGIENFEKIRFLDWQSIDNIAATHAGLQCLLVWALKAGEKLCRIIGEDEQAESCFACYKKMSTYRPNPGKCKSAAAFMTLSGLAEAEEINTNVLAVDPLNDLSTFIGYYVLQARAMAGDYAGSLDVIRRYWGGMLDVGATTFWEDFELNWLQDSTRIDELPVEGKKNIHADFGRHCYKGLRHSLCHGWAGGPTAWLSEHLLGVKFLDYGGRSVAIEPHLADIDWVEGAFPTAYGVIEIKAEKRPDGTIATDIHMPRDIKQVK